MTKPLQERWDDRWQEIIFIQSGIDRADLDAQLDASLVQEDLAPSLDGWPDSPEPFLLWRMPEQAA